MQTELFPKKCQPILQLKHPPEDGSGNRLLESVKSTINAEVWGL